MLSRTRSTSRSFSHKSGTSGSGTAQEPLSIYIHWPYCSSKCTYCNFNKYIDPKVDHDRMERSLIKELETEFKKWCAPLGVNTAQRPIRSIYFGGGTPSLARPSMFKGVLETIDRLGYISKDTEISMEGNPSSTTSVASLKNLRSLGINRYSLGVQSFQSSILQELGRDHTPASALRSLLDAKSVWPGKVSMDLIMGHRDQTLEDWIKELKFTMEIVDDHLSLYHLTVERGTELHKEVTKGNMTLPDIDLTTDMYEAMIEITSKDRFEHYEVSNFARNQAYSKHNSGHWQGIEYLGIGPGAHGRVQDQRTGERVRTYNTRDPATWMQLCEDHSTGLRRTATVSLQEFQQELVVLGMRTKFGLNLERFLHLTGQDLTRFLSSEVVQSCVDAGLVYWTNTSLAPTERGMAVSDELVARLLLS